MQNSIIAQTLTMSSREIAELTGKQHKDVLADCRKMFEALNIQSAEKSADYKDSKGRTYQEFLLDQDLTMTLVMRYSIELRHKVAKRWRELEEQENPANIPRCTAPRCRISRGKATSGIGQQEATRRRDSLPTKSLPGWHDSSPVLQSIERGEYYGSIPVSGRA